MKRAPVLGLVLLLAVGAWWALGRGAVRERGERAGEPVAALEANPSEPTTPVPPVDPVATSSREELGKWDEAELARAIWVEGRVLFPEGTPSDERAFVRAMGKKFVRGELHRAAVGADGSFRVAFAEGTKGGRLRLEARYMFLDQLAPWKTKTGEPVTLAPRLGGRIEGRVVWPQGSSPHESGIVFADSGFGERSCALAPDARFAFDALDPSEPRTLRFVGTRHLGQSGSVAIEAGRTSSIELEALTGVVLAGSVRDDAGKPVAQVFVALQGWSGWSTKTAPDGSFRLVVDPGPCVLWIQKQGHEEQTVDLGSLSLGEERSGIEIVLSRGGVVAGRVQWPDGTPARGALVSISQQLEQFGSNGLAFAAEDGSFEVAGLGEGPLRIYAKAVRAGPGTGAWRVAGDEEYCVAELLGVQAGARDLLVVLDTGHEVTGIVRAEGLAPVQAFHMAAQRQTSAFDPNERPLEKSFEGTSGHFSMGGLLPGDWELTCRAPGFAEASQLLAVPSDTPIEFVLTPGARLSGRVLDERGNPVMAAKVALDDERFFGEARGATGPAGAFVFADLRAGSHAGTLRLEAAGERCATRAAVAVTLGEAESSELTLTLHPAVPVEVRVRLGDAPAGGLELTLTDETGATRPARSWDDVTDLGPLPSGRYVLRARSGTYRAERAFEVRGDESELLLELDLE